MVEHQTPKSGFWGYIPPLDTYGYPGGGEVVSSNDQGQMRVGSVSMWWVKTGPRKSDFTCGWPYIKNHKMDLKS